MRTPAPLDDLSEPALRALVKLLLARGTCGTLVVSRTGPYEELQRAGWAYRVASVRNGFVFNEDNRAAIMTALHLRNEPA